MTRYQYGVTLADGPIASNDLVARILYPDAGDSGDACSYAYNRLGETTRFTDQNGTIHEYAIDKLGRRTADSVTTVGLNVDDAIRRIETEFDVQSRPVTVTSYSTPSPVSESSSSSGDTAMNQIAYTYDPFGQLATEAQEHAGLVDGSTPLVAYSYADGSAGTARLTRITYPNGRQVDSDYGSSGSDADLLSRVASLKDPTSPTYVEYTYLGLATAALTKYPQPNRTNTLLTNGTSTNPYGCLDRFGRLILADWGGSGANDKISYDYDRASNRTAIYRPTTGGDPLIQGQVLTYDGAHRLVENVRGSALQGVAPDKYLLDVTSREHWQLDATGNWRQYGQLLPTALPSGWNTEQARTANAANEITDIVRRGGSAWSTPEYDRNGNAVSFPVFGSSGTAEYDAWNRAVNISGSIYAYDGANRRISAGTRHYYYSSNWQVLEERVNASPNTAPAERQYVWGLRYIDDLVLRDRSPTNNGTLSEHLYALADANWNMMTLLDAAGTAQERYLYTAYGLPILYSPTWSRRATSSFDWNILYAGYRWDANTGLYQVRNRSLNSALGCWLTRDPIGFSGDVSNLYRYVGSSPCLFLDPMGLGRIAGSGDCTIIVNYNEDAHSRAHAEVFADGKHVRIDRNGKPLPDQKKSSQELGPKGRKLVKANLGLIKKEVDVMEANRAARKAEREAAKVIKGRNGAGVGKALGAIALLDQILTIGQANAEPHKCLAERKELTTKTYALVNGLNFMTCTDYFAQLGKYLICEGAGDSDAGLFSGAQIRTVCIGL